MRFSELRDREIINICDGRRLGCVCDAELKLSGEGGGAALLTALIVPGPPRFFGLLGREPDFLIPVECVVRMGTDVLRVEVKGEYRRGKRNKKTYR